MNLEGVLEGLLFLQGDEGITLEKICQILWSALYYGSKTSDIGNQIR